MIEQLLARRLPLAADKGIGILALGQKRRAPEQAGFDENLKTARRRFKTGIVAIEQVR